MSDATAGYENAEVARLLERELPELGIVTIDADLPAEPSIRGLRRRGYARTEDTIGILTLLDIDGVLMWEEGAVSTTTSRFRRRRGGAASDGTVVAQLKYEKALGTNRISEQLALLDKKLTPEGPAQLLEWDPTTWQARRIDKPRTNGRVLIFLHGTFSNSANLLGELTRDGSPGRDFLQQAVARNHYQQVLSFDHYTLSRSPVLNAIALARMFEDAKTLERIDVVCHSRGGLVARWWGEVLQPEILERLRVVFVGCPNGGTSLADPTSLRAALNLMSNVGRVLGATCSLIPFLTVAAGLMQIVGSVTSLAARTPIIDAGVAMIPGLAAMSRIKNNHELNTLNARPLPSQPSYSAIVSEFEPEAVSWRFWRLFSKSRLADAVTDPLVFKQANDLVIDTSSMTHHVFGAPIDPSARADVCLFDPSEHVHHTNYFIQQRTIAFLEQTLRF